MSLIVAMGHHSRGEINVTYAKLLGRFLGETVPNVSDYYPLPVPTNVTYFVVS